MAINYPTTVTTTGTIGGPNWLNPQYVQYPTTNNTVFTGPYYSSKELEIQQLTAMLRSRLRVPQHEQLPFDHIHPTRVDGTDTVVVLVISNKQHVLIEDGYELFPSDTLITQLRLLAK